MIKKIITIPHPILEKPTLEVPSEMIPTGQFQTLIEDMKDTCKSVNGLGLAANQVEESLNFFIYLDAKTGLFSVIINPEYLSKEGKVKSYGEGCLSIPGKFYDVKRAKRVTIKGLDPYGKEIVLKSRNKRQAICFQHEMDHLKGITLDDRA